MASPVKSPPQTEPSLLEVLASLNQISGTINRLVPGEAAVSGVTLQLIVEEAVAAGIEQIVLVTGRGKSAIEDHFDRSYELEDTLSRKNKPDLFNLVRRISDMARLISVRQKEPMGLGHAVLAARPAVGEEWFGVLLGDDLIDSEDPAIGQLARVSRKTGKAAVALMPVPDDQTNMYGVAAGKALGDGTIAVEQIVEKPPRGTAPSNLAVIGRYLLPPDIFGILEQVKPGAGGEIQLTDGIAALLKREPVYAFRFAGRRYDCGSKLGYIEAIVDFAMDDPELRKPLQAHIAAHR